MATNPYAWAATFADTANRRVDQSQADYNQALMAIFQEEALRQRPYATMPAALAQMNFNRQNQLPFDLAAEARALENWKTQRRFQQQLDIEEAQAIAGSTGLIPSMTTNPDGSVTTNIGGKDYVLPPRTSPNGNQ